MMMTNSSHFIQHYYQCGIFFAIFIALQTLPTSAGSLQQNYDVQIYLKVISLVRKNTESVKYQLQNLHIINAFYDCSVYQIELFQLWGLVREVTALTRKEYKLDRSFLL